MSSSANAPASPTHPSPTTKTKANRLPAPTLFVGPPSRNSSALNLSRTTTQDLAGSKSTRDPLTRTKSALRQPFQPVSAASAAKDAELAGPDPRGSTTSSSNNNTDNNPTAVQPAPAVARKSSERSVDAKWRELQNTMNEVELTAQSTTHVFGAGHAAALAELRRAQVELARAWGRGNEGMPGQQQLRTLENEQRGEGAATGLQPLTNSSGGGGGSNGSANKAEQGLGLERENPAPQQQQQRARGGTDASASTALSGESTASASGPASSSAASARPGAGSRGAARKSQLEDATAEDVRLASERRAANEAYFTKVDNGVKDVVAKLEAVAEAMRGMEGETRSLWSTSSSNMTTTADGAGEDRERRESAVAPG